MLSIHTRPPLPADVSRCGGQTVEHGGINMVADECMECRRRLAAAFDAPDAQVSWMTPPAVTPCPERRT